MNTETQWFAIAADKDVRIEAQVMPATEHVHIEHLSVEHELEFVALVYEREIVPRARRQVLAEAHSVRSVAEIHLHVKRAVRQKCHGHVVLVRKSAAGVKQDRVSHQGLDNNNVKSVNN